MTVYDTESSFDTFEKSRYLHIYVSKYMVSYILFLESNIIKVALKTQLFINTFQFSCSVTANFT